MKPLPLRAAACGILTALAAWGVAGAQEADPASAAPAAASINPLSSLELEKLEATRSLPLFTPSRAPPPVAPEPEIVAAVEAPPPPPPMPPALDLVGVLMTGSTELALLRERGSGEIHRLTAGEEYEGWAIAFVDARTVELRNGDQTQRLTMFEEFDTAGQPGPFGFTPFDPADPMAGLPPEFTGAVPESPIPPEALAPEEPLPDFLGAPPAQ